MSVAMEVPRADLRDHDDSHHVVVIDADLDAQDPVVGALARMGVVVHAVRDCLSALGRIAVTDADAVVVSLVADPQLPDMVRVVHDEIGLPVLLAHGSSLNSEQAAAVMAGAQPVVALPYDPEQFALTIRRVSRRRPEARPLVAGALQLKPAAYAARLGSHELDLSVREFNILHELVEHCDRVVPREALRRFVRGRLSSDPDRSVWAATTRLRTKLAAAGAPDAIRTVRAVGYALDSHRL